MSTWITTTLAVAVTALIAGNAANGGPCAPKTSHHCIDTSPAVDLNSVPDIAKKIAGEEMGIDDVE